MTKYLRIENIRWLRYLSSNSLRLEKLPQNVFSSMISQINRVFYLSFSYCFTDATAQARLPEYTAKALALRKKAICKIAELGYVNVVHNIRASAKILPKTAFFKDV